MHPVIYPIHRTLSPTVRFQQSRLHYVPMVHSVVPFVEESRMSISTKIELLVPDTKRSEICLLTPLKRLDNLGELSYNDAVKQVQYLEQRVVVLEDLVQQNKQAQTDQVLKQYKKRLEKATHDNIVLSQQLQDKSFALEKRQSNHHLDQLQDVYKSVIQSQQLEQATLNDYKQLYEEQLRQQATNYQNMQDLIAQREELLQESKKREYALTEQLKRCQQEIGDTKNRYEREGIRLAKELKECAMQNAEFKLASQTQIQKIETLTNQLQQRSQQERPKQSLREPPHSNSSSYPEERTQEQWKTNGQLEQLQNELQASQNQLTELKLLRQLETAKYEEAIKTSDQRASAINQQLEQAKNQAGAEIQRLKHELDRFEKDMAQLGQSLEDQIAENRDLRTKCAQAEQQSLLLKQELESHQNQIVLIEDQKEFVLSQHKEVHQNVEQLHGRLSVSNTELNEAKLVVQEKESVLNQLQDELSNFKLRIKELEQENENLVEVQKRSEQQIILIGQEKDDYVRQLDKLKDQKTSQDLRLEDLNQQLKLREAELAQMLPNMEKQDREIADLKQELDEERQSGKRQLKASDLTQETLMKQVKELQVLIQEGEQQRQQYLRTIQDNQRTSSDKDRSIKEKEIQLESQQDQLAHQNQQYEKLQQLYKGVLQSSQADREQFNQYKSSYDAQIKQSTYNFDALQELVLEKEQIIISQQQKLAQQQKNLDACDQEILDLTSTVSKGERDQGKLRQELLEMNQVNKDLSQHLSAALQEIDSLRAERKNMEQKSAETKQQHEIIMAQHQEAINNTERLNTQLQEYQLQLEEKTMTIKLHQEDMKRWMLNHQSLEDEALLLQRQNEQLMDELERSQQSLNGSFLSSKTGFFKQNLKLEEMQLNNVRQQQEIHRLTTIIQDTTNELEHYKQMTYSARDRPVKQSQLVSQKRKTNH